MNIHKIFMFMLLILGLSVGVSAIELTESINETQIGTGNVNSVSTGYEIHANKDINIVRVTKVSSSTGTRARVMSLDFTTTIGSATFVGDVATFGVGLVNLTAGTNYRIVMDNSGSNYNFGSMSGSWPYNRENINFVGRSVNGATSFSTYDSLVDIVSESTSVAGSLTFTNITANNVTLINNTFFNSSIDFETTILNTSTNDDINHSYSLNGGSFVQYGTNTLIGSVNLNLSEANYNISFQGVNNQTSVNSSNYTFTVDKTNPIIINNIPSEINSYNFNGDLFSCTDTNLLSCNISIDGFNEASGINFTLIHNGNLSYTITSTDSAGNVLQDTGVLFVNPVQLFNFQLSNGTSISDFTLGGIDFVTQANISTYNSIISLGNNTLLFEKLGFASTNITFNLNTTSVINLTTNITQSQINIRIFDRETNVLLTGLTAITIQATVGFEGSTTTGLLNVSNINFINEQYQILAEHVGYSTENVFFNYNNQETINIDIFMLSSNATESGQITIIVKNTLSQFVESAICSVLEWRPSESAFMSVGQGLSNVIGETLLNIELNTKIYKFSCTKDTFTTVTNSQIVQIDGSTLNIVLNDVILAPVPLFPNLVTSLTNSTLNATHQLITYTFVDSDGLTTEACLKVYLVNGNRQTFNTENCVSSSTGTILLTVDINQTSNILVQGTLTTDRVVGYVTDSLTFKGVGDIAGQFKIIGLDILIPTMLALLGLGLGILLSKIEIAAVFVAIAGWVSVAFVPTIMATSIAMFISVVVGLMLWLGFNRK